MHKKAQIIYFSGTGNTKAVAEAYEDFFKAAGYEVLCQSMEEAPIIGTVDLLVIGGPIYAGNMPDHLINWVRKNIPSQKADALVFSTSAGLANAHGIHSITQKLMKKGYNVLGAHPYVMPRNFYIDKYPPTPADEIRRLCEAYPKAVGNHLAEVTSLSRIQKVPSTLGIDLLADVFRIMAKSMGKHFSITSDCIKCGKCEKNCPKQNIRVETKKFSNRCMMCTRCIHNCPTNAIRYKGVKIEQYRLEK
jgi:ferredoxin